MNRGSGFTLVEALIGLAFVSVMTTGLAGLVVVSTRLIRDARDDTSASVLAIQKLEQLRQSIGAGAVVPVSPATSLEEDAAGFSDRTDAYIRRWSVTLPPSGVPSMRVLRVRVLAAHRLGNAPDASTVFGRVAGEVLLTTIVGPR